MSSARIALLVALLAGPILLAQQSTQPKAPAKPTKEQIARLIAQLGNDDFEAREEATKKLWEAGDVAEPALQEAAKSDDAEVSRRAKDLLDKFKWGIYPNTPQAVVEMITRYQGGEHTVVGSLLAAGPPGCRAIIKIAALEQNPEVRKEVLNQINLGLPRTLPLLLAENDHATLETLLAACLESAGKPGLSHAVAYWLLRGQLDQKIAHYKALEAKGGKVKDTAEILAYLYRAKGDIPAATEAARKAERNDLVEALRFESGDWKELARSPVVLDTHREIERLGYRLAYQRLAGDKKEAEETVAQVRKLVDPFKGEEEQLFDVAKVLFINRRPREALEILGKSDANAPAIFEILAAQQKHREALALVEKAKAALNNVKDEMAKKRAAAVVARLEILQARTLFGLGETEKARQIFGRLGEKIKADGAALKSEDDHSWFELLIESEVRVGLTDDAFEHAALVLALSGDQGWPSRLFSRLFPGRGETAEALWAALQALFPLDGVLPANLKRLRELMTGQTPRKDLALWIGNATAAFKNKSEESESWLLALAEAALACKQEDLAKQCLEKGGGPRSLIKQGDLCAGKKEWEQAARFYYQAWEKDLGLDVSNPRSLFKANVSQALPLYLSGKALVQAGKQKEGKQRMEQSHWMPLGNEMDRSSFCDSLSRRGESEAVRREIDLMQRLSQPGSYYAGDAMRRAALDAYQHKDLLRSADYQERAMLRVLRSYVKFVAQSAYVGVPAMIDRQRASGLLAAGKFDEAMALVAQCQEMLPGNVDLVIAVVPALEKRGKTREADQLFHKSVAVYEELCSAYPKCASAHNSIAWTAACCRRDLDNALEHARKAVELAPKNAGHLDTLSEVYFQRGDKAKAIEIEKKVIELEPGRAYFRKQLKRLEAGDPKAPLPPEADEEED